jgi:hypothetical protein
MSLQEGLANLLHLFFKLENRMVRRNKHLRVYRVCNQSKKYEKLKPSHYSSPLQKNQGLSGYIF